jgi:hypothetical protein
LAEVVLPKKTTSLKSDQSGVITITRPLARNLSMLLLLHVLRLDLSFIAKGGRSTDSVFDLHVRAVGSTHPQGLKPHNWHQRRIRHDSSACNGGRHQQEIHLSQAAQEQQYSQEEDAGQNNDSKRGQRPYQRDHPYFIEIEKLAESHPKVSEIVHRGLVDLLATARQELSKHLKVTRNHEPSNNFISSNLPIETSRTAKRLRPFGSPARKLQKKNESIDND